MAETIAIEFTLSGPDLAAIARTLAAHPAFNQSPPDHAQQGDRKLRSATNWRALLANPDNALRVSWGEYMQTHFSYLPPYVVSARIADFPADAAAAIELIAPLAFEVAAFGVMHDDWLASYTSPGFSGMHALLGFGCAFRAAGHDNLVSRRWLEYGPWRLLHGPADLSFVQFYDLAADSSTALAQAKPGHQRMGIGEHGGYLQPNYIYRSEVRGLYLAAERKLMIAAADPVSALQMRDACAARRARRHSATEPLESIGYMFISADLARAHLHELWLRELECWALIDGQKTRLDEGYSPPPVKPDWVVRLG
jgi:hypothetical protein